MVLAGDIFDVANPSLEELKLFYEGVNLLSQDVIIIGGNHEAIDKKSYTFDFLPKVGFKYYDFFTINTKKTDVYLCSHKSLSNLNNIHSDLKNKKNVLITHMRCKIPPHISEEFNTEYLANVFDLVISGDIHFPHKPYDNFIYTGSPYSTKYGTEVTHGYIVLDTDTLDTEYVELKLPNKIKLEVAVDAIDSLVLDTSNKYKLKVLGTIEELQSLPQGKHNVIWEKTLQTVEGTQSNVEVIGGKLDIVESLMNLTKEMFMLSDEVMSQGVTIIKPIVARYKGV